MFSAPQIQSVSTALFSKYRIETEVLRLDQVHPVVSGNKWYKLKYYLQQAKENNADTIATFGGAYSNHIVATAYAAKVSGYRSFGVIRGEMPGHFSHTLQDARGYGMQLLFVSRKEYQEKETISNRFRDFFWIGEGGYGADGARGISEVFDAVPLDKYSHIIVAAGTGTTLAGILKRSLPHQQVVGISVMKNNTSLAGQISSLLTKEERNKHFELMHDFHFGGYAKKNDALTGFINDVYTEARLPLDFVYTAKAFYGLTKLVEQNVIAAQSTVLFVHTGGLQGNLSLPPAALKF